MKKLVIISTLLAGLLGATVANAATAYWTGQMHMQQSVTGATGYNCQYMYAGNYFWRMFMGSCPSSIEVY